MNRPVPPSIRAVDRRLFLRHLARTGALLAAPLIVPARVLGAQGTAPSNRLRIGLIGLGRQALQINLPPFLLFPDTEVVALCDVDTWRLDQAQRKVAEHHARQSTAAPRPPCTAHGDFRELLARPNVDAVMISTPDHWHVPMALAAIRAGKDVSCEKPLTRSIAEGRRLADAVRQTHRVFRTDSEFRSLPDFRRACEIVRNGRLGRLHTIRTGVPQTDESKPLPEPQTVPEELDYDRWLGPAPQAPYHVDRVHPRHGFGRPGWMRCRDYCDGLILNWGTHLNDIAQWGNNTDRTGPVEIEGRGTFPPRDRLWNVLLEFEFECRYANGVRLHCRSGEPFVRFEGDDGWVSVTYGKALEASSESLRNWRPGPSELRLPDKTDKRDFVDAIRSRGTTMEDAEVGHRTASIGHLALIAIQLGRRLRWDPADERFPNDAEAQRLLEHPDIPPPHARRDQAPGNVHRSTLGA